VVGKWKIEGYPDPKKCSGDYSPTEKLEEIVEAYGELLELGGPPSKQIEKMLGIYEPPTIRERIGRVGGAALSALGINKQK
jgi:hypothetical protein